MPRERFSVATPQALSADAGESPGLLWNPSSTVTLHVVHVLWMQALAVAAETTRLTRITTDGAGGNTYTPDADNAYGRLVAPASGAYARSGNMTANPTEAGPDLWRQPWPNGAQTTGGRRFQKVALQVPPGTGLAFWVIVGGSAMSTTWTWEE